LEAFSRYVLTIKSQIDSVGLPGIVSGIESGQLNSSFAMKPANAQASLIIFSGKFSFRNEAA
jgi:hypothetical protein